MKLKLVKQTRYTLPFTQQFLTSKSSYIYRNGLIIKIKEDDGNLGFGEVAPLPGFGTETLLDAENSINNLSKFFANNCFENLTELNEKMISSNFSLAVISAVCFAAFQISFSDIKYQKTFFGKNNISETIKLSGVIGFNDLSKTLKQVETLSNKGFETIKIKIGRNNFNDDLEIIQGIANNFSNLKLRLDVNGNWDSDEALNNITQLFDFNIEYIEEPVNGIDNLIKLSEEMLKFSKIKIAIDESMQNLNDAKKIISSSTISYIIIKPSLLGGILNILELNKLAQLNNKSIVISSAFESALGRYQNALIASYINNDLAHGIDTTNFLHNDISDNFYSVQNNCLKIDLDNFPKNIISKLC